MQHFFNGRIYSPDFKTIYQSFLIKDGIFADFSLSDKAFMHADCEHINLQGAWVFPGFCDSHVHFGLTARHYAELELKDSQDTSDVCEMVNDAVRTKEPGQWIAGGGFPRGVLDDNPHRDMLDKVSPQNPVFLYSRDIHSFWVNTAALNMLDASIIESNLPLFEKRNGELTGIIFEKGDRFFAPLVKYEESDLSQAFYRACSYFHSFGITAVHSMEDESVFHSIIEAGLPLNFSFYLPYESGVKQGAEGIKLFYDGSLGSLTAWNYKPFTQTDSCGIPVISESDMSVCMQYCADNGIIPAVHAIGDRACGSLIQLFRFHEKNGWRIEHAQTIADSDLGNFENIVFSMQPGHILFDIPIARTYLSDRQHEMYRFRSVLDNGGTLLFGSDCPVDEPDVIRGIWAASERKDPATEKLWQNQERITRAEALNAYTYAPAHYMKENYGIQAEAPSDFTVIDTDILHCSSDELKTAKILKTYVKGMLQFERNSI